MEIWIFENSYYIGNDENVQQNAIRSETIRALDEGEITKVRNGVVSIEMEIDCEA